MLLSSLRRLRRLIPGLRRDETGQGLIEYVLIISLVSLAAVVSLGFLSGKIQDLYQKITFGSGNSLNHVAQPPSGGTGTISTPPTASCGPLTFGYTYYRAGSVTGIGLFPNIGDSSGYEGIYVPSTDSGLDPLIAQINAGCSLPTTFSVDGYTFSCSWSVGFWATPGGIQFGAACLTTSLTASLSPAGSVPLGTTLTASVTGGTLSGGQQYVWTWYRNDSTDCADNTYAQFDTDTTTANTDPKTLNDGSDGGDGDRCYYVVVAIRSGFLNTSPQSKPSNHVILTLPTPPATPVIDSGPSNPSSDRTPTFTFHDTAPAAGNTFQCSVDSTTNYNTCASPFTTGQLNAGSRTFRVRVRNSVNQPSAPAVFTWTVQQPANPGVPAFDTTPPNPDTDRTPTFAFHDTTNPAQAGITLQCSIDSTNNFNDCSSGTWTSGSNLSAGGASHTFRVRARNAEWNLNSTNATFTWTINNPPAPTNTGLPTISGTAKVAQVLTGNQGTWTGAASFQNQWRRCNSSGGSCANIAGATGLTYTLVAADQGQTIRFQVTADNGFGNTTVATSVQTAVVAAPDPPGNQTLPSISGTLAQGSTLTGNRGTWSNSPTSFTQQWVRCTTSSGGCSNIAGATNLTYTLTSLDVGRWIVFHVTATNGGGNGNADSAFAGPVGVAPNNSGAPTIAPTTGLHFNSPATVVTVTNNGTWTGTPAPTFTYQWQRCTSAFNCLINNYTNIAGATGSSYTVTSADNGLRVRVVVTGTNAFGSDTGTSNNTNAIGP